MSLLSFIKEKVTQLAEEVRAARESGDTKPRPPVVRIRTPGTDEEIELAKFTLFDHPPTPEELFKEAQRVAMDYAQQRSGNADITWKQTKVMFDKWAKEERRWIADQQRAAKQQAATFTRIAADAAPPRTFERL